MTKNPNELEILKARLEAFEKNLQDLLKNTEEDLRIAEGLQKALMPNRVPGITGLKIHAKFISAKQLSSESFDIIESKDKRYVWIVNSWTERYGLSSLLLQVLVHLQSVALVNSFSSPDIHQVFNDLSLSLTQTQKTGHYSLRVLRLDLSTLKIQGLSIGQGPLLIRKLEGARLGGFEIFQAEMLMQNPALLQKAFSANPVLAENAYAFTGSLEPGTRLYILGKEWNAPSADLQSFVAPLALLSGVKPGSETLDDLNHLVYRADEFRKKLGLESDITGISLEIDARKLHLA